jgi:NB-ARC domain
LFSNRYATGGKLVALNEVLQNKPYDQTIIVYDAEKIANELLKNLGSTNKLEQILENLPQSFQLYKIFPETNRLPDFRGTYYPRQEESNIHEKLVDTSWIQLWGLSGIGKTETAISIARSIGRSFDTVIWLDGDEFTSQRINFSTIKILKFDQRLNLSFILNNYKTLLILDNFNNSLNDIKADFDRENLKNSRCIVTSLQKNFSEDNSFQINFLSHELSNKILLESHKISKEDSQELISVTGGYPLILNLIKSLIEFDNLSCQEVLNEINEIYRHEDEASQSQTISNRVIGRFIQVLEKEFMFLKYLSSKKIYAELLNYVLGKLSTQKLIKRAILKKQDLSFFDIHQIILDSINAIISIDDLTIQDFNNKIYDFLAKEGDVRGLKKTTKYYGFLIHHRSFIERLYESNTTDNRLKKTILYGIIQSARIETSKYDLLNEIKKFEAKDSFSKIDVLIRIEAIELELIGIGRRDNRDIYQDKAKQGIKYFKTLLDSNLSPDILLAVKHHLAKLYLWCEEVELAETIFKEIVDDDTTAFHARLQLARIYERRHETELMKREVEFSLDRAHPNEEMSLPVLLGFYELTSNYKLRDLRTRFIDENMAQFTEILLGSLDSVFIYPLELLGKLASHLSYNSREYFDIICSNLPVPSITGSEQQLKLAYAKVQLSYFRFLKYSGNEENYDKMSIAFNLAERYFQAVDLDNDYLRGLLIDLYIESNNFERAKPITNCLSEVNPFNLQKRCKVERGLGNTSLSIEFINKAINLEEEIGNRKNYLAAFYNDKAETLFLAKDIICLDMLNQAIVLQENNKTRDVWLRKKDEWEKIF